MSSTAVIDHYLRRQMPDIGEVVADALPVFVLFVLGGAHSVVIRQGGVTTAVPALDLDERRPMSHGPSDGRSHIRPPAPRPGHRRPP